MTNFTKRSQAVSEKAIGKSRIGTSNHGKDMFGLKISNKERLKMAKTGAKNLIDGTIKVNRIDKGLPPLKRPPRKKKGK